MKNTFADLHNHLMARIEALGDEDLDGEELDAEIRRARATSAIAARAIHNGRLMLDAQRQAYDMGVLESDEQARNRLLLPEGKDGAQ